MGEGECGAAGSRTGMAAIMEAARGVRSLSRGGWLSNRPADASCCLAGELGDGIVGVVARLMLTDSSDRRRRLRGRSDLYWRVSFGWPSSQIWMEDMPGGVDRESVVYIKVGLFSAFTYRLL